MSKVGIEIKSNEIAQEAERTLLKRLPLNISGYKCNAAMLYQVLIYAAVTQQAIETVCQALSGVVSGQTIRTHLNTCFNIEQLDLLEGQINQLLAGQLSRSWRRRRLSLAIDYHDEPYWGQSEALLPYTCGGQADQGTTRFFRVATLYTVHQGERLTLACLFVRPEDAHEQVVNDLLYRLFQLGLRVRRVCLDRGFCSVAVCQLIEATGLTAIIACPLRGQKGGTRALCKGRKSRRTTYTFYARTKQAYEVPMVVVRTYSTRKKRRHKAQWLLFVSLNNQSPPLTIKRWYRQRFGIESSYRLMRQNKAMTKSQNAALRFLLIALAFFLVNLWVALQQRHRHLCPDPKTLRLFTRRFSLNLFRSFLKLALETLYPPSSTLALLI